MTEPTPTHQEAVVLPPAAAVPIAAETHGKHWWDPIAHFAAHTTVATAIFILTAIPALGIGVALHYLSQWPDAPPFTVFVLDLLEKAVVSVEALVIVAYFVREGFKILREIP